MRSTFATWAKYKNKHLIKAPLCTSDFSLAQHDKRAVFTVDTMNALEFVQVVLHSAHETRTEEEAHFWRKHPLTAFYLVISFKIKATSKISVI